MHRYPLYFVFGLAVTALSMPVRAQQPQPQQAARSPRVWTSEDMDGLRARGLISIVGPAEEAVSVPAAASAEPSPSPALQGAASRSPRPVRVQDPAWYAEQAAQLEAELRAREEAVRQSLDALAQTRSLRNMQPGVDMSRGNAGVTPEEGIAVLEAERREVQLQLDELADLARRNGIPPGALRG